MNANTETAGSGMDTAKLIASIVIIGVGIYGFYYLEDQALWVRLLGLLAMVAVAVFVAVQTQVGRGVWSFAIESRNEVRKVVWPSRQETLQTLLVVFIAVLLTALFLWAIDSLLFMVVRSLTGQG